jgi:phenylpyruvate tautomerase PptA (4-oxalocrotonate tautomerase family)
LVEAFSIPEDDRTQRIVEHDPENFEIPPGASRRYTLIEITAFPGRSATAKRSLYEAIVRNLATAGVPAQDILVVLHEPPMENWGIRGGNRPTTWISATGWTSDSVAEYGSGAVEPSALDEDDQARSSGVRRRLAKLLER